MSVLLRNLLRFGGLLRSLQLPVPAGRMLEVATALEHVEVGRRSDFYFTLRALLVHRQQDLTVFDEAFRMFWRRPPGEWSQSDLRAMGEQRRIGPPEPQPPIANIGEQRTSSTRVETVERVAPLSYGNAPVSRTKDFAAFTDTELAQAKTMLASLRWTPGRRRTRRWRSAPKGKVDLRRMVARSAKYGGEPLVFPARARLLKQRPLVLLCDVSGSMERYSRILLHFAHSLSARVGRPIGIDRVEAFLFATRLTRVTNSLVRQGADAAAQRILRELPDWGGGTRIGEALRSFNVNWSRRVTGRGPVVLLISDGWDRGEPEDLRREIARLRRSSHRLIWLNPLLGSPDYRPLTRGMQAALPLVDDFLPIHNLASLESLAAHLNALTIGRTHGRRVEVRSWRSEVRG